MRPRKKFVLSLGALLFLTSAAFAQTTMWTNGTGDWLDASHWDNGLPNATTDAQVNNGGIAQIGAPGAAAQNLTLGLALSDSGTISVGAGGVLDVTNFITVGSAGAGSLAISGGGTVSNTDAIIGNDATSIGMVTVDGTGSSWTNNGDLTVGNFGNGTLHITNGAHVFNFSGVIGGDGSHGAVTVDGADTTWNNDVNIYVGYDSQSSGSLSITNGAVVTSFSSYIAFGNGSTGMVMVDGAGSTWDNVGLDVGSSGTGTLIITNGAVVNGSGLVGNEHGAVGHVIVDGTDSEWDPGSTEIIGVFGTGTLAITNGGTVVNGNGIIASEASGTGSVTVDGIDSTWINAELFVGGSPAGQGGIGLLRITNDATVITFSTTTVFEEGTIFGGNGTLIGDVLNRGLVGPGDGTPGTLSISGDYTQSSIGTLRIQIGGLSMAEHDLLSVDGNVSLDGTLRLVRLNNFLPVPGDQLVILTAGSVDGQFSTIVTEDLGIVRVQVIYEADDVLIEFLARSFQIRGLTPNQRTVARNLDGMLGDPRARDLIDFLTNEPRGNLPHDYDLIAPEELASIYEIGFSHATIQSLNLQRRMDDIRAGSTGFSDTGLSIALVQANPRSAQLSPTGESVGKDAPSPMMQSTADNRWGVFVTGTGEFVNVGNDDFNAAGYDITTGGFTLGLDYRICPTFAIGVDGGYARSWADPQNDGRVTVDGGKAGVYAVWFPSEFYVKGAFNAGYNSYDTRRAALLGDAGGSTDGYELDAFFGAGYDWKIKSWRFGPIAAIACTSIDFNGFTEDGSLAPLHFSDQNEDSLRSTVGASVGYDRKIRGTIVRPELRAAWQHEFADRAYPIDSQFASGAGEVFTVWGPQIGRDAVLASASVLVQWNDRLSTYLAYDGVFGRDNYDSSNISGGARFSF
jgi:T5SS/PEP-CTERM-associated repeat protein